MSGMGKRSTAKNTQGKNEGKGSTRDGSNKESITKGGKYRYGNYKGLKEREAAR